MAGVRIRLRSLSAVALVALVLAACSVDATVNVRVEEDGSGEVSVQVVLDADAVKAVEITGGELAQKIRLDDLAGAGWTVGQWARGNRGGASITVSKPFSRPAEVRSIVREISGPRGPLRRFSASRQADRFSTQFRVSGLVDLRSIDPGVTDDAELVAQLTNGQVDAAAVQARVTAEAVAGLRVRARVEVPGATDQVDARPGERATVSAVAEDTAIGRILMLVGGIALVLAAAVVAVRGVRARRIGPDEPPPVRSPAE